MKQAIALALFMTALIPAFAFAQQTVWIRAQGVDADHPKDNFISFYQDSAAFVKRCKESSQHPACYLFMDTNLNHAAKPEQVRALNLPTAPLATKDAVLGTFRTELLKSKSGDTIVLNLNSHGSPSKTANSCIWMSDQQPICETDLQKILPLKPAGVLVYIDAEGCFSGGFVDLARKDVCVSVAADRRSAGISDEGFLWTRLNARSAHTLSGIGVETASRQIQSIMCLKARKEVFLGWPAGSSFSDTQEVDWSKPLINDNFLSQSFVIQGDSDDFQRLYSYGRGYEQFLQQASKITCSKVGFTGDLCEALQTFLSRDFFMKIRQINEVTAQLVRTPQNPNLMQEYNSKFSILLHGKYFQAWQKISPCLTNIESDFFPEEQAYLSSHRGAIPLFPRVFNQSDFDAAKSCEASLAF